MGQDVSALRDRLSQIVGQAVSCPTVCPTAVPCPTPSGSGQTRLSHAPETLVLVAYATSPARPAPRTRVDTVLGDPVMLKAAGLQVEGRTRLSEVLSMDHCPICRAWSMSGSCLRSYDENRRRTDHLAAATQTRGAGGADTWDDDLPANVIPLWTTPDREGRSRLLGFGSKAPERAWNELVALDLGRLVSVEGLIGGVRLA